MTTLTLPGRTPHAAPVSDQQIVRIEAVEALTQLSRGAIYHMIKRGQFPSSIQLSEKARGWRLREIEAYLASRTAPDANSWRPKTGKAQKAPATEVQP